MPACVFPRILSLTTNHFNRMNSVGKHILTQNIFMFVMVRFRFPADRRSLVALLEVLEYRYGDEHLQHVYRAQFNEGKRLVLVNPFDVQYSLVPITLIHYSN